MADRILARGLPMTPEELLKSGDAEGALAALSEKVRANPGDNRLRIFLFQLMCVLGQWDRAIRQLKICGEKDPAALPMAQTYREAIICEVYREKVFAGDKSPLVMGEPQDWLAQLIEAGRLTAKGETAAGAALRAQAFDAAPVSKGMIDGQAFDWIADADVRLGPVFEAIVNGKYYWIPFNQIREITFDPPTDLRDAVWTAAHLTLVTEGKVVALIPSRYPFSGQKGAAAEKLARATSFADLGDETFVGMGQKLIATDQGDIPLLDARLVSFAG
jgi:type VI secretion system protein ImpE